MADYNPYHVLGVYANSSEREILKNIGKVKAYQKVGKQPKFDVDFPFLPKLQRTEELMRQAYSEINTAGKNSFYALLWFIKTSDLDEQAFRALKQGQIEPAIALWQENLSDISSLWNLSTLYTLNANSIDKAKLALEYKHNLFQEPELKDFMLSNHLEFRQELYSEILKELINILKKSFTQEEFNNLLAQIPQLNEKLFTIVHSKELNTLRIKLNEFKTALEESFDIRLERQVLKFHNQVKELIDKSSGKTRQIYYFLEEVAEFYVLFAKRYLEYLRDTLPVSINITPVRQIIEELSKQLDEQSIIYKNTRDTIKELKEFKKHYNEYKIFIKNKDIIEELDKKLDELLKELEEIQIKRNFNVNNISEIPSELIAFPAYTELFSIKKQIKEIKEQLGENIYFQTIIEKFNIIAILGAPFYLIGMRELSNTRFVIERVNTLLTFASAQTQIEDLKKQADELKKKLNILSAIQNRYTHFDTFTNFNTFTNYTPTYETNDNLIESVRGCLLLLAFIFILILPLLCN